jgi:hypothetical protein
MKKLNLKVKQETADMPHIPTVVRLKHSNNH